MAKGYKHSGARVPVATASAGITSGALVYQEGFVGVALTSALSGASLWLAREGVWNIKVPSGTVKGDILVHALSAESTDMTLVRGVQNGTYAIGVALTTRDTAGYADVLLTGATKHNPIATDAAGTPKVSLVAGTDTGANVTLAAISAADSLVSVLSFTTAAAIATVADRTAEYVAGAGVLTKAAGTDETNNQLVVFWVDLT